MQKTLLCSLLLPLVSCVYFPDGREVWQPVPLSGVITSCTDGMAIKGALVQSSNHAQAVNTDIKGAFRIGGSRKTLHLTRLSDSYQEGVLSVSAVGYIRLEQNVRYYSPSDKEQELNVRCLMTLQS